MKKVLFTLICLFVSFKVKSGEIVLLCQINQEFRGNSNLPIRSEYKPFESMIMYLDIKKKHFYKQSLNDIIFKNRIKSFVESDYTYSTDIKFSINNENINSDFKVKENNKITDSEFFYLNRYDGYFKYNRTINGTRNSKLGNCKRAKKKLF